MKSFAIFGASGCGRGVMPLARQQLAGHVEPYDLVFVDDAPPALTINGLRAMTFAEWVKQPGISRLICIAVANGLVRQQLVERCDRYGINFFETRANNVVQMDDVTIGEGAILCPFVTLTSNIRIGRHFHANIYSYVEHDCVIGDYVTFAPGVKCNGNVVIEDHAYIGTGAILRQGTPSVPLVIGRGAVVGMGAIVTKDVAPGDTVIGNPARVMMPRV